MVHSRAIFRDIEERLGEVPGEASGPAPAWLAASMNEMLGCELFGAYRPSRDEHGIWRLGDLVGTRPEVFAAYDAAMHRTAHPFKYDPLRPAANQKNQVHLLADLHTHGPDETCAIEDVWPHVGMGGCDQIRALVCEGPVLLAWVGGFRQRPFTQKERRLFAELLPVLQRALALHRRLADAADGERELANVLEPLAAPAFIARRDGSVEHANAIGRELCDCCCSDVRARVRDAITGVDQASFAGRVGARGGATERFLVILRDEATILCARLNEARKRWNATAREIDVLRLVASGDSNKEVGVKLGVHEGTIERHITSLLRKAQCESRARLIARFWTQT